MREHDRKYLPGNQRGQASVFVLALLGVVLLCVVFLYHSGRVTSEKMQLQNAADAAAFSAVTLQARSLNFSAYTNRAMVANEVAVGQLVGLLSWSDQLTTSKKYAHAYAVAVELAGAALATAVSPTVVGPALVEAAVQFIAGTIEAMGTGMNTVGTAMKAFLDPIAAPFIRGLSLINKTYSTSQMIYHGATYGAVVKNLYQSLEDNTEGTKFNRTDIFKKDLEGAQVSDLGIIAVVGHIPSFWSGYTRTYSTPTSSSGKQKKEDVEKAMAGIGRFAATVRESRDPFSSGDKDSNTNRDWNLDLDLKFSVSVPNPIPFLDDIKFSAEYILGAESYGGTELRYKNGYTWTAADTAVMGSTFKVKILGLSPSHTFNLPFGSSGFQAPQSPDSVMSLIDWPPSVIIKPYGNPKPEAYGKADGFEHILAWPEAMFAIQKNVVKGDPYTGLQPYRDMASMTPRAPGTSDYPFQAPFFMVGFTRTLHDVDKRGPQFAGSLDLTSYDSSTNIDRLGAIARAELYFLRPVKPSYFARIVDGHIDPQIEKPNVFSPFWQGRLVDTSDKDRFLALAVQQKVLWLTEKEKKLIGGSVLKNIKEFIGKVLDALIDVVKGVLKIFS